MGLDLIEPVGFEFPGDVELQQAVAQIDRHADPQPGQQLGHVQGDEHALVMGRIRAFVGQAEEQRLALVHGARRGGHFADAGLGTAQIGHGCERHAHLAFQRPDGFDDGREIGRVGMGKVQAENAHPMPHHLAHGVRRKGCGA